jgi:hypothetical protein
MLKITAYSYEQDIRDDRDPIGTAFQMERTRNYKSAEELATVRRKASSALSASTDGNFAWREYVVKARDGRNTWHCLSDSQVRGRNAGPTMEGFCSKDLREYCEATPPCNATMEHQNSDNSLRQHACKMRWRLS